MASLSIVRGNFTAVKTSMKKPTAKDVRAQALVNGMKNVFVCPGLCGTCVKSKGKNIHACGSSKTFNNINVVIGIH